MPPAQLAAVRAAVRDANRLAKRNAFTVIFDKRKERNQRSGRYRSADPAVTVSVPDRCVSSPPGYIQQFADSP